MAPNRPNYRPSEVTPPDPKKRKTVPLSYTTTPILSQASRDPHVRERELGQSSRNFLSDREHATTQIQSAPFKDAGSISRPRIVATPARPPARTMQEPASRGGSVAPVPRMLATPARPQARTAREQVGRPSPMNQRLVTMKVTTKQQNQRQSSSAQVIRSGSGMMPIARRAVVNTREISTSSYPAIASGLSDSDVSSDDNFKISKPIILSRGPRLPPQGHRAARKFKIQAARKTIALSVPEPLQNDRGSPITSDHVRNRDVEEEEDDLYVDGDPVILHPVQRLRDGDADTPSPSLMHTPDVDAPEDPERELNDALNALSIHESTLQARGRLPFLRRHLRKSMDALGALKRRGLRSDTLRSDGITKVTVVFVMGENRFVGGQFRGRWFCPVCSINMCFNSRAGLDAHLYRYHTQCDFDWSEDENNSLLLTITLPEIPETDTESEEDDDFSSTSETEETASDERPMPLTLNRSPTPEEKPFLRGSSVVRAQTAFTSSPFKVQPESPQLSPVRPRKQQSRVKPSRPPRPIDPQNPARYPTPPPCMDLEGPAAVYPYIAEDTYSARPGGPRLYDILNELPLEPFGVMSWYIIDKEEDIFELDNMRDEDKVMLALWGRWIFLNRQKFIAHYKKGAQMFIDEYWRIIHRAAGLSALRIWLLALVQNRFLTGIEFCDLLQYYIDLVGMVYWK